MITTLAGIGLCFAVVLTTPAVAPAAPVGGACETTGTKAKVPTTFYSPESKTYVPVSETAIPFTQRRTGCVIISFSAEANTNTNTVMFVTAVVDGFSCVPYDTAFAVYHIEIAVARTMNFLCPNVPGPGNHTASIMARSGGTGGVWLEKRTTIVLYAK